MSQISRFVGLFLLAGVLAGSMVVTGCAVRAGYGYRDHDGYHYRGDGYHGYRGDHAYAYRQYIRVPRLGDLDRDQQKL